MMEHMSGAIMAISPGGTVQSVNNLACDLLHLTEEQLVGQNLLKLLSAHAENGPLIDVLEECLDGSRSLFSHRAVLVARPGEITPVSVSTSPLHTAEGRTYSTVVNLQNIEKLREFYRNVNRTDRLAAIGTLAMGMAHEIRNPLGSIKGLTQLMVQDAAQDNDTRRFGEVILGEVDRLDKLLSELLNFSQPAGTTVEPVDLATMAGHVVDMATIRIAERAEESGKPLPPCTLELPVTGVVIASRDKLFQALFNIVINAFEAALGVGEVVVSTQRVGEGKVRLRITNTGSTIPVELRDKIFEPFFTTKERGTGLGLALAYQILTYAGANIQLRAESAQVTFEVDFPAGLENGKPTLMSVASSSGEYHRPDAPV
jgi:PAS domain S-box-containing protein